MIKIKETKAITLVALIVTIIILLILAGVTIAQLTGNGLFEKAKLAKDKQENAQIEENLVLSGYENAINQTIMNGRDTIYKNEIEYENLIIKKDEEENRLKYYYEDREIFPIYWYGFETNPLETVTAWYETNYKQQLEKKEKSFLFTWNKTINYSQCAGGLVTTLNVDLANFKECHIIINSSTTTVSPQYVRNTGYMGSSTSNETNYITNIPKVVDGPKEYIVDITSVTGAYYMGISAWRHSDAGSIDIAAWWLE